MMRRVPEETIEIRAATAADVPAILSFIRALAEYEKLTHACVADESALRETLFSQNPAAEILIANIDRTPAGFALYFRSYSTFLARPGIFLEDLFVLPQFRRRGVGKALLQRLARVVVDRNYGRLEWSVLDWNTPAIEFYRRCGAVAMGDWTMFRLAGEALEKFAADLRAR